MLDQQLREILAAQIIVPGHCPDFQNILKKFQNRHIKGSAAQVKNQEFCIFLLLV